MRRMLVVGCGGSGGATLAYMMDQLRAQLADQGIHKLPDGWQFVHIDVPVSAPPGPDKLGNVREQGGRYLGIGPQNGRYAVLDNALSTALAHQRRLDLMATWAPNDPAGVSVPLSEGAGQYRALGRMVTLSKAALVKETLEDAWKRLFHANTAHEMSTMRLPGAGGFDSAAKPLVLIVSSMAGGAGASMALDVCRILTLVQGVDPKLMAIFMVAPDIFDNIERDSTPGVRPNALAMLGEIVASQTGAAHAHDVSALEAAGQQNGLGERIPFARVFPVSLYLGLERTQIGDGMPQAVYRSLGRGLAALTASEKALQEFIEFDLTNTLGLPGRRQYLGWGNTPWDTLPWGTFGFASLSMGRDRYAEYSAQRLARSTADRLLRGHIFDGNPANDDDQIRAILDSQWPNVLTGVGLPNLRTSQSAPGTSAGPAASDQVAAWLTGSLIPPHIGLNMARQVVASQLSPYIPPATGLAAQTWVPHVQGQIRQRRESMAHAANEAAYAWAFAWNTAFLAKVEQHVEAAISEVSLPYATMLVARLESHIEEVARAALELSVRGPADISELPDDVRARLGLLKGTLAHADAVRGDIEQGSTDTVGRYLRATICGHIARALQKVVPEALVPMRRGLDESHKLLRAASATTPTQDRGLARVETDIYALWPADADYKVGDRWAEATNEVMLTSSTAFKQLYELHIPESAGIKNTDLQGVRTAIRTSTRAVATGKWDVTDGSQAPGELVPLVERTSEWRSSHFTRDPESGESMVGRPGVYDVHVRPGELLARARAYVARTGYLFQKYCDVSLRDYLLTGTASDITANTRDLVEKFRHTLVLARPLASVNAEAVLALHGVPPQYKYKFSSVPFADLPVEQEIVRIVEALPEVTSATRGLLERAMSDEKGIKKVDVFGSFPNYSPLAFTSVIDPARDQWTSQTSTQQRLEFWKWRRTRPLAASLPMHTDERRRMVGGWLLGRLVGLVYVPPRPYTEPVQVWNTEQARWVSFPNPLLTPPARFKADYEWLPAVLESVLIAIARSHERPVFDSLLPYSTLRSIYDSDLEEPTTGLMTVAAEDVLADWLRTGRSQSGEPSAMKAADSATSIDERAEIAKNWFTLQANFVSTDFMASGEGREPGKRGALGGGRFSVITKREHASQTPLYRDLAPDVFWAANDLLDRVEKCRLAAHNPSPSGRGPDLGGPHPTQHSQSPDDFTPPQLEAF